MSSARLNQIGWVLWFLAIALLAIAGGAWLAGMRKPHFVLYVDPDTVPPREPVETPEETEAAQRSIDTETGTDNPFDALDGDIEEEDDSEDSEDEILQ